MQISLCPVMLMFNWLVLRVPGPGPGPGLVGPYKHHDDGVMIVHEIMLSGSTEELMENVFGVILFCEIALCKNSFVLAFGFLGAIEAPLICPLMTQIPST